MNHPVLINHSTHTLISTQTMPIWDKDNKKSPYYIRQLTWRYWSDDGKQHWDRIEVEILSNSEKYFTFARNCPNTPPLLYVKQYNQEFLVTSGDYQCISIYNLTKRTFKEYVYPRDDEYIHYRGFCPLEYKYKDNTLTIIGQVPYGPMEIMIIHDIDLDNITFKNIEWDDYYKEEGEENI